MIINIGEVQPDDIIFVTTALAYPHDRELVSFTGQVERVKPSEDNPKKLMIIFVGYCVPYLDIATRIITAKPLQALANYAYVDNTLTAVLLYRPSLDRIGMPRLS